MCDVDVIHPDFNLTPLNDAGRGGMTLLSQTYMYARDADIDQWEFAIEINLLYEAGFTISDLRWLVAKGLVEHGLETSVYGDTLRSFRRSSGLRFETASCLVLTPRGLAFADSFNEAIPTPPSPESSDTTSVANIATQPASDGLSGARKPHWNRSRRELLLGVDSVKRFRVPARNQELILNVFEEEDWPEHIDDPLPTSGSVDPHTRLHDAINRLNGNQTRPLLRFRGNGNGTGISWELRKPK